jgi:class 3 adenylate cyclase
LGDGFLVVFHTAVEALDFSLDIYSDPGDGRIKVRVGTHVGAVNINENDISSIAVAFAERVKSVAHDGGILFSKEAYSQIDQERAARHERLQWVKHAECDLKGFGINELYSINVPNEQNVKSYLT